MLSEIVKSILPNLVTGFLQGQFSNHPLMKQAQAMLNGKSKQEQLTTLLNTAQTMGIDVNEKCFTAEDLKKMGINL